METIGRYNAAVYRVSQSMMNYKLRDLDIRSGQYDFFYVISKNEGISQKELSNHLYIGKSTTAKAVKNLMDSGYITREQDPGDKRYYRLYLTEKGKQVAPKIEATFLEMIDIFTRDLSGNEGEQTLNGLKKILNRLYEEKGKISADID